MRRIPSSTAFRVHLCVLLGVVLALGGAGLALAGVTRTHTHIYRAFKSSGAPAIQVTKKVRGTCNGGSSAINRSDAWRCFAGNFVCDPCFSSKRAKGIVLCPSAPWKSSGIKIKLTAGLVNGNRAKPSTSGQPWALETTSGVKCEISTGATTVLGHRRANYFCQGSLNVLWGFPSRKLEPWKIYAAPATAKKLTHKVKISVAWF